jgi:feruloyl esterase
LAALRDAAAGQAHPLAQGYVTFGTDSGYDTKDYGATELTKFALNDEMFENFAHASYKQVKDVAHDVVKAYYQLAPEKT